MDKLDYIKPNFEQWAANLVEFALYSGTDEGLVGMIENQLKNAYDKGVTLGMRQARELLVNGETS